MLSVAQLCFLLILVYRSIQIRPLVLIHGLGGNFEVFDTLISRVKSYYPDIVTISLDAFNNQFSEVTLQRQIPVFSHLVFNITREYGYVTLLGYSQGGLIARAIVEGSDNRHIHTLITLSSPLAGEFGTVGEPCFFEPSIKNEDVWEICYNLRGQNNSGCNQWKDPFHIGEYLKHSEILPYLDNENYHASLHRYIENFESLQRLVLIGGPDDGVIVPWETAQFGFYDENLSVIPMRAQQFYVNNWFGLKTLGDKNLIDLCTVENVSHGNWTTSEITLETCILPYLDME